MKHVVSDTVDASKELYQTIKRKSSGEEEREYSHSITSDRSNDESFLIKNCRLQIEQIISDSGYQVREVLSESSEVSKVADNQTVKCKLLVVVSK